MHDAAAALSVMYTEATVHLMTLQHQARLQNSSRSYEEKIPPPTITFHSTCTLAHSSTITSDAGGVQGKPTGAVRVSFGYMSTFEDACAVLDLVSEFFMGPKAPAASRKLELASKGKSLPPIRTGRQPKKDGEDMQLMRSASLSHFLPSLLTSTGACPSLPRSAHLPAFCSSPAGQSWSACPQGWV